MAPQGAASASRFGHAVGSIRTFDADGRTLPRHELPARQTSFVGRKLELEELTQLLTAPNCRLVTIIGPGGIGKTRLAIEATDAVHATFADGVVFVSLQSLSPLESIAPAIAAVIGCVLNGHGDERGQVARFLRAANMLLVLDNFEHLLAEASWLGELLAGAPGLRLLVTSREALNLQEEWRYPLAGLELPGDDAGDPAGSEAVQLFLKRAQQVRPDFSIESDRDGVVQLCRITEGLPLALELAAAWIRTLSCAGIAAEIERNVAFLATELRNVPARHRSMHAAFDHSWELLSEDERKVFQRLAVFHSGFSREAAEQIAGATLPLLSSLVDKSLLRRDAGGRFQLHELLRQYANEHLRSLPDEAVLTATAHREYYLGFVEGRFDAMVGGAQRIAVTEIATELDNIRAAWRGAVAAGDAEALGQVAHTLTLFFDFRARYYEGHALLEDGLRVLRSAPPSPRIERTIAAMLVDFVRINHRLARLPSMRAALEETEALYDRLGVALPRGQMTDPLLWRALLTLIDGHYGQAIQLSAEAVERNTSANLPHNLPLAYWVLAAATFWQQEVETAAVYARKCAEAAIAIGDRWHLAYCHNIQGHVAAARKEYVEAQRHYQDSYTLREEFDDPEGMGTGLTHLARIAALQGDLAEAERLYRIGLAIARDIGDQIGTANTLNGLGTTACAAGDYAAAGQHFAEGLRLMSEVQMTRLLLTFVASAGEWLMRTGRPAEAIDPLALARSHAGSDRGTRSRAEKLLEEVAAAIPQEVYASTIERSRDTDPVVLASHLIPLLTAPLPHFPISSSPPPATRRAEAASALIEPLTARELSVLRLIADGYSNRGIADELYLSESTVRSYNQQIFGKLGVGSRTQAVARARGLGLLN